MPRRFTAIASFPGAATCFNEAAASNAAEIPPERTGGRSHPGGFNEAAASNAAEIESYAAPPCERERLLQ